MKRFGWGVLAGLARVPGEKDTFVKHEESSSEEEIYHPSRTTQIYAPRPHSPQLRRGLDFGPEYRRPSSFESGVDAWETFIVPDSPPPTPVRILGVDAASADVPVVSSNPSSRFTSKTFDYKQAMVSYVSTGFLPTPFSQEPGHNIPVPPPKAIPNPITIIVTSPSPSAAMDGQGFSHPPFDSIMARNIRKSSRISLEPHVFDPLPKPKMDKNRLMPPIDDQLDVRKRRKAEEFRKVREFLIEFLNAKGDQFPRKMRVNIMGLYKIHQEDLAPEMRANFERDLWDEGVVLHADDMESGLIKGESNTLAKEKDDRTESLELLKMAFRTQYLDALPQHDPATDRNLVWNQRGRSMPHPEQTRRMSLSRGSVAAGSTNDEPFPSRGLPRKISRSPNEHPLRVSSSVPNLQGRPRRVSKSTPSSSSVPTIRTPSGSVTDLRLGQGSKRRLLFGALSAVREAMGGKARLREGL